VAPWRSPTPSPSWMKKGTDPRVRVGTAMAATPLPAWPTYPINTNTSCFVSRLVLH